MLYIIMFAGMCVIRCYKNDLLLVRLFFVKLEGSYEGRISKLEA